jgi:hypothetical protein
MTGLIAYKDTSHPMLQELRVVLQDAVNVSWRYGA